MVQLILRAVSASSMLLFSLANFLFVLSLYSYISASKRKFDQSGSSEMRTFHGASFQILKNILSTSTTVYSKIERVALCLGSRDCNKRNLDVQHIVDDITDLLKTAEKIFPNARISLVGIPPQSKPKINSFIMKINDKLKHYLKGSHFSFIACEDIWSHVDPKFSLERRMLQGATQLSPASVALMLGAIKSHFFKIARKVPSPQHEDPHSKFNQTFSESQRECSSPEIGNANQEPHLTMNTYNDKQSQSHSIQSTPTSSYSPNAYINSNPTGNFLHPRPIYAPNGRYPFPPMMVSPNGDFWMIPNFNFHHRMMNNFSAHTQRLQCHKNTPQNQSLDHDRQI